MLMYFCTFCFPQISDDVAPDISVLFMATSGAIILDESFWESNFFISSRKCIINDAGNNSPSLTIVICKIENPFKYQIFYTNVERV